MMFVVAHKFEFAVCGMFVDCLRFFVDQQCSVCHRSFAFLESDVFVNE